MSGPKVLRTITLEELVEMANIQMAVVDLALRRWRAEVSDTDVDVDARCHSFLTDRTFVEAAVATGQPDEIVRRANVVIAAIDHDIDRMRDAGYVQQAKIKTQQRSLQFMSQSLLKRCREFAINIPNDQLAILQSASAGQITDSGKVSKVISHCLDQTIKSNDQGIRSSQGALASLLQDGTHPVSASDLLKRMEYEGQDPRIHVADRQIAELRKHGDIQAAERYEQRLGELVDPSATVESSQFSLSLDSLGVELATRVKRARALSDIRRKLESEIAAAAVTQDTADCQSMFAAASIAIERGKIEAACEQLRKIREILDSRHQSRAIQAGRTAILQGLNQLGYAVQEGMATSWADNKRLVIQHPAKPGIALELAGSSESVRIQTRMVAVEGVHRDSQSDRDVELNWCSEVQTLQASLAKSGCHVEIEKALPAGAHPLKVVANTSAIDDAAYILRRQREMKK